MAQASDPAVSRIDAYDQAIIGVMKQGRALGLSGRVERFQSIVENYYDNAAAAALVIGAPWAKASPEEKAAVIAAIARLQCDRPRQQLQELRRRALCRRSQKRRAGRRSPRARADRRQRTHLPPAPSGGQWKIIDVIAQGVSQLAVQRSDYASTVASAGVGGLAKRIAALDAQTLKGR